MAQLTIYNLDEQTLQALKRIAESRGHTLEQEAVEILRSATERATVQAERTVLLQKLGRFHTRMKNRHLTPSAHLIREDRDST